MNIGYSFFLTFLAAFSTLLGSILVLFKFKDINKVIISSLSFSSSVMLSISLFDLMPEAIKLYLLNYNPLITIILYLIFFIIGSLLVILINKILPKNNNLYKIGLITMIGIILHNIPEGILTFLASSYDKKLGFTLFISICMHNIPEGISISIPIYYSTGSKFKGIFYSFISAISEVFGAFLTYIFLYDYVNDILIAILLSIVCGIMSYISIFELIPESLSYKNKKLFIIFFIIGIVFMLINLM